MVAAVAAEVGTAGRAGTAAVPRSVKEGSVSAGLACSLLIAAGASSVLLFQFF